jgi:hypothetical protein
MKSLEHLIREIREGKCSCEKKKESLESTIRKVNNKEYESSFGAKDSKPVDEDVAGMCGSTDGKTYAEDGKKKKVNKEDGGDKLPGAEDKMDEELSAIGTDEYQGNQFKSVRTSTPHIRPPGKSSEGTEGQAPENVSRQRTLAKEKSSMTVHGKVTEGKVDLAIKGVSKLADTVMDIAKPYVASKSKQLVPYVSKEVQAAKSAETTAVKAAPAAAEKLPVPAEAPKTKSSPPVVPPKTETATATKPQVPVVTPTATATKPQVPVVTPTATATKPAPVAVPKTGTKTAPASPPKGSEPPVSPPKGGKPSLPGPDIRLPKFFGTSGPQNVGKPSIHAPWKVHGTKAERHFNENVNGTEIRKKIFDMPIGGDRKKTSYVGRPEDNVKTPSEKLSRQTQYKFKIIDEGKKLASIVKKSVKEYESGGKPKVFDRGEDVIVINPNLKKIDLESKNEF